MPPSPAGRQATPDRPRCTGSCGGPGREPHRGSGRLLCGALSHPCSLGPLQEVTAHLIPSSKQPRTCQLPWQPPKRPLAFSTLRSSRWSLWTTVEESSLGAGQLASHAAPGWRGPAAPLPVLGTAGVEGHAGPCGMSHWHRGDHVAPGAGQAEPTGKRGSAGHRACSAGLGNLGSRHLWGSKAETRPFQWVPRGPGRPQPRPPPGDGGTAF